MCSISEFNQLFKITDMLGHPPEDILERGSNTASFYNKLPYTGGRMKYIFNNMANN